MKKRFLKWLRDWSLIDLIGFGVGVLLIISYIYKSVSFNNSRIDDIWSNLASEIVGVWLSVRIIDKVIDRRNKKNNTRFHLLRNLKHFLKIAQNYVVWNSPKKIDLEELIKEQYYFHQRWGRRKKCLYDSEIKKVDNIEILKNEIITEIKTLLLYFEQNKTDDNQFDKSRLNESLQQYDSLLEALREDIWEDSPPDDL